jgi:hypothetical protein
MKYINKNKPGSTSDGKGLQTTHQTQHDTNQALHNMISDFK